MNSARIAVGCVSAIAVAVVSVIAPVPALAADGDIISLQLQQSTGTAPFDAGDGNGDDSGAGNDIVRTNDSVTYQVSVRLEGEGQTKPTITFSLPRGEQLSSLPKFCLAGSSVTPTSLPQPTVPVTADSWKSLPSQKITCVLADQDGSSSLNYEFVSKVRPEVPNGTVLGPVSVSGTSDQVTTPAVSPEVRHTVSAAPEVDLSKRVNATSPTQGPLGSTYSVCRFDNTQTCRRFDYPITMSIPSGGKGMAPLSGPISFADDLTPDSYFPPGTTSSQAWQDAGADALKRYGAHLVGCPEGQVMMPWSLPGSALSVKNATTDNAVRNSGAISCTQPDGAGTKVQIKLTGTDTTGFTVPKTDWNGSTLPVDRGLIVSYVIQVEIPVRAVQDLGLDKDGTWQINSHNQYTDFTATDVNGTPVSDSNPDNNVRDAIIRLDRGGPGTTSKAFVGITGRRGNTPSSAFSTNPQFEGPPGSGTIRDGNTVVVKGQTVISSMLYTRHGIPPLADDTFLNSNVLCDTWDSSTLQLPGTFDFPGASSTLLREPSRGSAAWLAYAGDGSALPVDKVKNVKIQYGWTDTPGRGAASDCRTGSWADSPADVSGAELVDGTWKGVNRVRISFTDIAPRGTDYFQANGAVALTVVSDEAPGTILPNWASQTALPGIVPMADVLSNPKSSQANSSYTPSTATGQLGDRLILGKASVRLKKRVWDSDAGAYTDAGVPQYTAGNTVKYQLSPSLTADVNDGVFADVTVEDCLPEYLSFVSATRPGGGEITPELIQAGAPAGSELTCGPDETYIRWNLGSNEIGKVIDPINYTVEVLETAPNGTYTNRALVSSPSDASAVRLRGDDAQILLRVPTGIKISKSVDKPQIEVNPDGATEPRSFTWTIRFANVDDPRNVSNVDFIDVLPADGLLGSDFTGDLTLDAVSAKAASDGAQSSVRILYTSQATADLAVDPDHATNAADGATVWCDAADGSGQVVIGDGDDADCPATPADVTGLRFLRDGQFTAKDTVQAKIRMTPVGNAGGDLYRNRTAGRADGVTQPVGPSVRSVKVIASSLGDTVWVDLNRNGLQDDDEPGVPDFAVHLSGTDLDGNAIELDTTTDADGRYLFSNLPSGEYVVTFDPDSLPAGAEFTRQDVGENDRVDSDGDATTGVTGTVALHPDSDDRTVDQGLVYKLGSLTWSKTDEAGDALAGSVWTLTGPGGYSENVADNGNLDEDPADGAFQVTGLAWGDYTLTEKTAPQGYEPIADPLTETVDGDSLDVSFGDIENTRIAGSMTWTKTDPQGDALAGSAWTLTGPDGYSEEIADNGDLDEDPADGAFKVTGLAWGEYTLTEKTAPQGYELITDPVTATVDAGHLAIEVGNIENTRTPGSLTWTKSDEAGDALAGSVWTLTGPGGYSEEIADNGSLDEDPADGAFKVTGLAWGEYTLQEKTAPQGYDLITDPLTETVNGADLDVSFGDIENTRTPGVVTWTKTDPQGKALAGSVWELTGPDGYSEEIADNGDLDAAPAKGAFKVTDLAWGDYTLVETKAPKGYVLSTKEHTLTLDSGHLTVEIGDLENTPMSQPAIKTRTSKAKAVVGSKLRDRITITGFKAGGDATGTVALYGPFASRKDATCTPKNLVGSRTFTPRNGTQVSKPIKVREPGYYTWMASTTADALNAAAGHRCGMASETSLVHKKQFTPPDVDAGYSGLEPRSAERLGETRLKYTGVGTDADVKGVGISKGKVNIPSNVRTLGQLRQSAGLADVIGSTVVVGHVSDRHDSPGAFYRLSKAKKGQIVEVTQDGETHRFKVTGKASFSRDKGPGIPAKYFSTTGRHQLVLISCTGKVTKPSGHFHYTRNLVVTAVPVS